MRAYIQPHALTYACAHIWYYIMGDYYIRYSCYYRVEVMGSDGYLIDQCLIQHTNRP